MFHRQYGEFTFLHSMIPFATVIDVLGAVLFHLTLIVCEFFIYLFILFIPMHFLNFDTLWHFNRYTLVKRKPMCGHCDV